MTDLLKWVAQNLLFDFYEYVYWLSIIGNDLFDIIRVRDISRLDIKYEYLMLYVGLHVKVRLNEWKQL